MVIIFNNKGETMLKSKQILLKTLSLILFISLTSSNLLYADIYDDWKKTNEVHLTALQTLLFKTGKGIDYDKEWDIICEKAKTDINNAVQRARASTRQRNLAMAIKWHLRVWKDIKKDGKQLAFAFEKIHKQIEMIKKAESHYVAMENFYKQGGERIDDFWIAYRTCFQKLGSGAVVKACAESFSGSLWDVVLASVNVTSLSLFASCMSNYVDRYFGPYWLSTFYAEVTKDAKEIAVFRTNMDYKKLKEKIRKVKDLIIIKQTDKNKDYLDDEKIWDERMMQILEDYRKVYDSYKIQTDSLVTLRLFNSYAWCSKSGSFMEADIQLRGMYGAGKKVLIKVNELLSFNTKKKE